jgi:DNA-3-methyladenine glycosylase II
LLESATKHLVSVDAKWKPFIELNPCSIFSPEGLSEKRGAFDRLLQSVIAQQLSVHAARAISARFKALFDADALPEDAFPPPELVLGTDDATLRSAGLSQRKAEYVKDLAAKFADGTLSDELFATLSDAEVVEALTAVRGLGVWTAEMFLIFGLRRPDVMSMGDLGLQRGMAHWLGKDVKALRGKKGKNKYMSPDEMEALAEPYRPYRSVLAWYLWRFDGVRIAVDAESKTKKGKAEEGEKGEEDEKGEKDEKDDEKVVRGV